MDALPHILPLQGRAGLLRNQFEQALCARSREIREIDPLDCKPLILVHSAGCCRERVRRVARGLIPIVLVAIVLTRPGYSGTQRGYRQTPVTPIVPTQGGRTRRPDQPRKYDSSHSLQTQTGSSLVRVMVGSMKKCRAVLHLARETGRHL